MRLFLIASMILTGCSSSDPAPSSDGGGFSADISGNESDTGVCGSATECPCWKCACGGGGTGSNSGCSFGKCLTGEEACAMACNLFGDTGTPTATEDPTRAACAR